jgi:ParB family chromosome partitioning protein
VASIRIDDDKNGRLHHHSESITELARTIANDGQLNPITVQRDGAGFVLVAGRRRLLACTQLGWTDIRATVQHPDRRLMAVSRLMENCARRDLSPIEEACQLAELVKLHPHGVDGVATMLGRRVDWILDRLDLCDWPPLLQQFVHERRVTLAAGKHLVRIHDPEVRERYIQAAADNGCTATNAAYWVRQANSADLPQSDTSDFSSEEEVTEYQTNTKARCFTCSQLVELQRTTSQRLCHDCLRAVAGAIRQTDQPVQPPPDQPYDPNQL